MGMVGFMLVGVVLFVLIVLVGCVRKFIGKWLLLVKFSVIVIVLFVVIVLVVCISIR